jgi:hypothetical protein
VSEWALVLLIYSPDKVCLVEKVSGLLERSIIAQPFSYSLAANEMIFHLDFKELAGSDQVAGHPNIGLAGVGVATGMSPSISQRP